MSNKKLAFAICLLLAIALLHLLIPERELTLHILLRLVYLIPITLVALGKGRKGGVLAALAATVFFIPHFLFQRATPEFNAGNIVAVILFNLTGFFVGFYRDRSEQGYISSQQNQIVHKSMNASSRLLFFVDNSPLSQGAAEWFASTFPNRELSLTLLWVQHKSTEDVHGSKREADEQSRQLRTKGDSLLEEIRNSLIQADFPEENVHVQIRETEEKTRTSDVILGEVEEGGYDMVLLGKPSQTKAQEFLFGDVAVRLLRTARVPVISVVGSAVEPE